MMDVERRKVGISESNGIVVAAASRRGNDNGLAPAAAARHAGAASGAHARREERHAEDAYCPDDRRCRDALTAFAPTDVARAQKASAPADVVKELAPTGKLRAGINLGNPVLAQKIRRRGELGGISVDLARELGKRLGVPVELIDFQARRAFVRGAWRRPRSRTSRSSRSSRSVPPKSRSRRPMWSSTAPTWWPRTLPLKTPADVDRPGIRVGVGLGLGL